MQRAFRDRAIEYFKAQLGEPIVAKVDMGNLYRWTLPRAGHTSLNIYITIDSPEMPSLAHIMVSDPAQEADHPIKSFIVRSDSEFETVMAYIRTRAERTR